MLSGGVQGAFHPAQEQFGPHGVFRELQHPVRAFAGYALARKDVLAIATGGVLGPDRVRFAIVGHGTSPLVRREHMHSRSPVMAIGCR